MTVTLIDWCQNGAIALLLAWVVLLSRRWSRRDQRVAALKTWGWFRDPEYWTERDGRQAGPVLNDEPEPEGLPDCEEAGGFHVAGDGKTCQRCPAVLV